MSVVVVIVVVVWDNNGSGKELWLLWCGMMVVVVCGDCCGSEG